MSAGLWFLLGFCVAWSGGIVWTATLAPPWSLLALLGLNVSVPAAYLTWRAIQEGD